MKSVKFKYDLFNAWPIEVMRYISQCQRFLKICQEDIHLPFVDNILEINVYKVIIIVKIVVFDFV